MNETIWKMKQRWVTLCLVIFASFVARAGFCADSCVTTACHGNISAIARPHAPVKEGDCTSCHQAKVKQHPLPQGKSFVLARTGAGLCTQCHDPFGKKKIVHLPVKEGDCSACHSPHGTGNRNLLDVGEDQRPLCNGCHDATAFQQKFLHGPVAVGACTQCHNPHESDENHLFKISSRERCLKCHGDFAKSMNDAKIVHAPVQLNQCYSCHFAHGASNPGFLKKQLPMLCTDCHKKIGDRMVKAKVPHKPLQQEGGCITCHSAHFAKAKGLLADTEQVVCFGCHGKDNLGTPPLRNIKKDLDGKKFLHGPLNNGECKGCHDPHGSDFFRMLRGNYPKELYAPYREGLYDACMKCHEKNLLRFTETSIYTKFRNGKRNLHYVHVVNNRKGRTCRICHAPHASDGEKLVHKVGHKFGDWEIPINFKMTATGGSCAPGCHRAYRYDREQPAVYGSYSTNQAPK